MTQKPPSINSYFLGDSIKFMIIGLADHDDNWLWAACVPKPLDIEQPWYHWTERCLYRETCPCDIPWRLACVKSGPARFNSVVCIEEVFEWKKRRKWTPERKAKFRMANLEKRVAKRNPMFYEWEKARELKGREDYLDAEKIAEEPDREAEIEKERLERWDTVRAVEYPGPPGSPEKDPMWGAMSCSEARYIGGKKIAERDEKQLRMF